MSLFQTSLHPSRLQISSGSFFRSVIPHGIAYRKNIACTTLTRSLVTPFHFFKHLLNFIKTQISYFCYIFSILPMSDTWNDSLGLDLALTSLFRTSSYLIHAFSNMHLILSLCFMLGNCHSLEILFCIFILVSTMPELLKN
jgi:hypothetical protein